MYKKAQNSNAVIRLEDGAYIPKPPDGQWTPDWQAYLDWIAAGNIAAPNTDDNIPALKRQALASLELSDRVFIRCGKAGVQSC